MFRRFFGPDTETAGRRHGGGRPDERPHDRGRHRDRQPSSPSWRPCRRSAPASSPRPRTRWPGPPTPTSRSATRRRPSSSTRSRTRGSLDEPTPILVAEMAKLQARTVGGTEDYVVDPRVRGARQRPAEAGHPPRLLRRQSAASGPSRPRSRARSTRSLTSSPSTPPSCRRIRAEFHEQLSSVQAVRRAPARADGRAALDGADPSALAHRRACRSRPRAWSPVPRTTRLPTRWWSRSRSIGGERFKVLLTDPDDIAVANELSPARTRRASRTAASCASHRRQRGLHLVARPGRLRVRRRDHRGLRRHPVATSSRARHERSLLPVVGHHRPTSIRRPDPRRIPSRWRSRCQTRRSQPRDRAHPRCVSERTPTTRRWRRKRHRPQRRAAMNHLRSAASQRSNRRPARASRAARAGSSSSRATNGWSQRREPRS